MKTKYAECVAPAVREPLENDKEQIAVLLEDWVVKVDGCIFTIPKGTVSDGASVPEWLDCICGSPMKKPRLYPAIVHDWLYDGNIPGIRRQVADRIYYLLSRHFGRGMTHSLAEYYAVRMFGWSHWYGGTYDIIQALKDF